MKRKQFKINHWLLAAVVVGLFSIIFVFRHGVADLYAKWQRGPIPRAVSREEFTKKTAPPTSVPTGSVEPKQATTSPEPSPTPVKTQPNLPAYRPTDLPTSINLAVPFVLQAPFAVWDALHDDACEEASAIMMKGFAQSETSYTKEEMERQILAVVDFEDQTFGFSKDTDTAHTLRILNEFLGIPAAQMKPIDSVEDIKRELSRGSPVLVPAYGRALKNPYFRQGGPLYHMLVIKGYTPGKFITHDPGTKRGADYVYDEKLLWNAIHDWNDGDVPNGPKVMIVIE